MSTEADTNGLHFAGDSFKCIFLIEKVWILIHISLKKFLNDPINNISTLVQIMAWHRAGDKPLSEPMMAYMTDAYMRHSVSRSYGHLSILFTHSSTFLTHTNRVKTSLNALKHIRCLNVLYGVKVFKMCSSNATGDRSSNKLQWLNFNLSLGTKIVVPAMATRVTCPVTATYLLDARHSCCECDHKY